MEDDVIKFLMSQQNSKGVGATIEKSSHGKQRRSTTLEKTNIRQRVVDITP